MGADSSATATAAPGRESTLPSVWDDIREAVSLGNYKPEVRKDLTWAQLRTRRGRPYSVLADRPRRYIRLTAEDYDIARQMDGTRRISDLVVDYFHRTGRFGFDRIASLVRELRGGGFLRDAPRQVYSDLSSELRPSRSASRSSRWEGTPLRLRLPLRGIDGFMTSYYQHVGRFFYLRPMLWLSGALAVVGAVAFVGQLRGGRDPFAPLGSSQLAGLVVLVVGYYGTVFIHESAHALTCKHFGRRVDEAGFMLYYLVPAFYVVVTDMWLEPWRRRIAVFWAGPYSGFVVGGVASILVFLFPGGIVATLLFKLALVAYVNNALNLVPFLLLDGYWILEEWMETPRLRERALQFVKAPMWKMLLKGRAFSRREVFYAIFGGLCAVYSFLSVYLGFLYWGRRLSPVVRPLWRTPGLLPKVILGLVIGVAGVPLSIRFARVLQTYLRVARQAPQMASKALRAINMRDRLRLLEGLGFLSALPIPSIERLAHAARVREVPTGAAVVRQSERGDEFFIIALGEAEVAVRESGDDRVVANLKVGDFFGEGALLGPGVRGATVRALTPLKLLVISQRTFWAELAGTVGWQARVRSALAERSRLQAVPLLADASSRQLDVLAVRLQIQSFGEGDVLVRQADPGDAFFIVRDGALEVEKEENGVRQALAALQPGDFFGEIALLHNVPRTATVRGLKAGSVWRLERKDFQELLGRYLNLEGHLAGVAAARAVHGHSMREVA